MSRNLYILLTRFPDRGSQAIGSFMEEFYTHASIGLDEDPNTFYSFVSKGFLEEKVTRYLKPGRPPFPCRLYELAVSDRVYRAMKRLLRHYAALRPALRYDNLGVILSLMHIPHLRSRRFFCSQFVAHALHTTSAARLKKDVSLYLPADLARLPGLRLRFCGNMQGLAEQYRLLPV